MSYRSEKIRCKRCQTQLAGVDASGLTILRGALQATFSGQFTASLVCYRCSALNVLQHGTAPPRGP